MQFKKCKSEASKSEIICEPNLLEKTEKHQIY